MGANASSSTLAVMQPYVFPYLGYFQLIQASDQFVFYDDVNFIKQGWINRNRILINRQPHTFTVPIQNISSFVAINQCWVYEFSTFKRKFLKQVEQAYTNAPFFQVGMAYIHTVLSVEVLSISDLAIHSVQQFCKLMDMGKVFVKSSDFCADLKGLPKQDRLIAMTQRAGTGTYINPVGGQHLYDKAGFAKAGLSLKFLTSNLSPYQQLRTSSFVSGLSIIDVLMHNDKPAIHRMLSEYSVS